MTTMKPNRIRKGKSKMNEQLLEELNELMDNGAGMIEIFEYIQDNTDEDPVKYISLLK